MRWSVHRATALAVVCVATASLRCSDPPRLARVLPPDVRVDVFPQAARAQLDALFVVDNSRFMAPHQRRVADSFHRFLEYLERNQIDSHLGLVTTDVTAQPGAYVGGGQKRYFAAGDEKLAENFAGAIVSIGAGGNAMAAALEQADLALRAPPAGFLRPGASLFIVLVTDNNDPWSPGEDLYYFRTYKQSKGPGNDGIVSLAALAGDVPDGCTIPDPQNPQQTFFAQPAPRLRDLAQRMGGPFHSLCDPAFDTVFEALGAQAAGLKRNFRLGRIPDVSTLAVSVRARCDTRREALAACAQLSDECGEQFAALVCTPQQGGADGWTYDAQTNTVTFHGASMPPRGAFVEIQYKERRP